MDVVQDDENDQIRLPQRYILNLTYKREFYSELEFGRKYSFRAETLKKYILSHMCDSEN